MKKILILSDIHANWAALQAVAVAETSWDAVVCLGDVVNYGPQPANCVQWILEQVQHRGWAVQGNHDRAVGRGEDPRCSPAFRDLAAAMQRFTEQQLPETERRWLTGLPAWADFWLDGLRVLACHATPTEPFFDYVGADDLPRWQREVRYAGEPDFLLVGHTHEPFRHRVGRTEVINPGSVGQGKHGQGGEACYAVWEDRQIILRRVSYAAELVAEELLNCAPPEIARRLGQVLLTGRP